MTFPGADLVAIAIASCKEILASEEYSDFDFPLTEMLPSIVVRLLAKTSSCPRQRNKLSIDR